LINFFLILHGEKRVTLYSYNAVKKGTPIFVLLAAIIDIYMRGFSFFPIKFPWISHYPIYFIYFLFYSGSRPGKYLIYGCMYLSIYIYIKLYVFLSIYPSVYLSTFLSIHRFIRTRTRDYHYFNSMLASLFLFSSITSIYLCIYNICWFIYMHRCIYYIYMYV